MNSYSGEALEKQLNDIQCHFKLIYILRIYYVPCIKYEILAFADE